MSEIGEWAPHETRVFALQVAVEFVNGDKRKVAYTTSDVLKIACEFEEYLTGTPVAGYEGKAHTFA